jgi:hypothetical protein
VVSQHLDPEACAVSGWPATGGLTERQPGPREIRASDADRDATAGQLSVGLADGRLTVAEHAERVEAAYAARTLSELGELTADLPAGPQTVAGRGRAGSHGQIDPCLLCALLILCPPAGVALLLARRRSNTAAGASRRVPIAGRLRPGGSGAEDR